MAPREELLLPDGRRIKAVFTASACEEMVEEAKEPEEELMAKARTVPGSTAGAGSDFFNVYRKTRGRELARVQQMEDEGREEEAEEAFQQRREERILASLKKTAKKAAKRAKRRDKTGPLGRLGTRTRGEKVSHAPIIPIEENGNKGSTAAQTSGVGGGGGGDSAHPEREARSDGEREAAGGEGDEQSPPAGAGGIVLNEET